MIRTEASILTDIWKYVNNSELATAISGEVIKSRKRPLNSKKEDIIIMPLANVPAQRQQGVVNCNIYVPDIIDEGQYDKDGVRCDALEEIAASILEVFSLSGMRVVLESQHTYEVKDCQCHVINNRLSYQLINE